jgi:hypothetical protein
MSIPLIRTVSYGSTLRGPVASVTVVEDVIANVETHPVDRLLGERWD